MFFQFAFMTASRRRISTTSSLICEFWEANGAFTPPFTFPIFRPLRPTREADWAESEKKGVINPTLWRIVMTGVIIDTIYLMDFDVRKQFAPSPRAFPRKTGFIRKKLSAHKLLLTSIHKLILSELMVMKNLQLNPFYFRLALLEASFLKTLSHGSFTPKQTLPTVFNKFWRV